MLMFCKSLSISFSQVILCPPFGSGTYFLASFKAFLAGVDYFLAVSVIVHTIVVFVSLLFDSKVPSLFFCKVLHL